MFTPNDHRKVDDLLFIIAICIGLWIVIGVCGCAYSYTIDDYVTAIGKAEHSKAHPYGIMVKYRSTSPKQACFNTVAHKHRLWLALVAKKGVEMPFLTYLANHYAPIGAENDPNGLNRNWERNVNWFLTHNNKGGI